jgi:hypothetical protein
MSDFKPPSTPGWKPTLLLDWDGVINPYSQGWKDGVLYETTVTPGFFEWATEAKKQFKLVIYSSRSKTPEGIAAMKTWLAERWMEWKPAGLDAGMALVTDFEFAHEKDKAFLTIDDRCMQFRGDWAAPWLNPDVLLAFKPWNVK